MDFINFARSHGLIVNNVYANRWIAVPTDDHPRKKNGRYKWLGEVGWVQNWATMESPVMWKGERSSPLSIRRMVEQSNQDREKDARAAARKAGWILHQSVMAEHPYLEQKGFPKECGNVWDNGTRLLVIPMRINGRLVGVQFIDEQGKKQFLRGQITKGASFVMDAKGLPIFVEGYATGLSVREAMKSVNLRYTIHVCFSAGNLQEIARSVNGGIVVADHDENGTGEKAAIATGKPYWLSETRGDDFNDYHRREGIFHAGQSLKKLILSTEARHAVGT